MAMAMAMAMARMRDLPINEFKIEHAGLARDPRRLPEAYQGDAHLGGPWTSAAARGCADAHLNALCCVAMASGAFRCRA